MPAPLTKRLGTTAATLTLLLAGLAARAAAQSPATAADSLPTIREFLLPEAPAPGTLHLDSTGAVWVSFPDNNRIARFDPASQTFKTYTLPRPRLRPFGLHTDDRGRVWFTQDGTGRLARFTPGSSRLQEYISPTARDLQALVAGPNGFLWFTAPRSNRIGRFNPRTLNLREFSLPTRDAQPADLSMSPDRILWFTEFAAGKLGRLDPARETVTEIELAASAAGPFGVAAGREAVWLTLRTAGKLARYDRSSRRWTEWLSPGGAGAEPAGIALGTDGAVWYGEASAGRLVRFDPATGGFTVLALPLGPGRITRAVAAPDGAVWLLIEAATPGAPNRIAKVTPSPAPQAGNQEE